jgi:iron complex outermembrane recepter protein
MKRFLLLCGVVLSLPTLPSSALAQDKGTVQLEEVIVTANRREQSLQDVAVSVAAFTGEFFKDSGTTNLNQLEQYTPSLKISPVQDSRSTSIRIRGIGSIGTNAGIDPSVGLFIDGVYQGRAGMSITDFLDIRSVEVLRGPQGTLYGKNTAAGALNITSNKPSDHFEGEIEAVVGNEDALEFRGMINLPLGDSGAATRFSAYNVDRDGFDTNVTLNDKVNDADKWGVRNRTSFPMGDHGDILVSFDYAENNSECCAPDIIDYEGEGFPLGTPFPLLSEVYNIPLPTEDPLDRNLYFNQPWTNEVSVGGVAAEWNTQLQNELGVTWLNAWRTYESDSRFDGDFSPFDAVSGAADVSLDQYSSELRFTSPLGDTFDYVAGLYYFYSDMDTDGETGMLADLGQVFADGLIFPNGSINFDENRHETESVAAFGQVNWHINEKWRLTGGGRVTHEEKQREGLQRTEPKTELDAPPISGPDVSTDGTRSETDFSPSLIATHFIRDGLMIYASASQGYKSGGFNQVRTAVGAPREFDDERSRNYELGWKGTWLDRRLQVNGTFFWVDYDDFQAQGFDGANITVRNAGSLESKGLELDVVYVPNANLTLGMAVGYNDAEYSDFDRGECTIAQLFAVTGGSPFVAPDCVQDLGGRELDNAPEWTVSTFMQYEAQLTDQLGWQARLEYNYTDEFYMAQDLDENLLNEDHELVNASVSIFGDERNWEIALWGRNLFDEETFVIGFDVPVISGYAAINAPPRTYGLRIRYKFGN